MDEFLSLVTSKLGTGTDAAKSATGGLLRLIKAHGDKSDVSELFSKLPGAESLLGEAPEMGGGGGGGLLGSIASAVGGDAGTALGAVEMFSKSGLSLDKAGSFVDMFKDFAMKHAGEALIKRLLAKIPGLGSLLG